MMNFFFIEYQKNLCRYSLSHPTPHTKKYTMQNNQLPNSLPKTIARTRRPEKMRRNYFGTNRFS